MLYVRCLSRFLSLCFPLSLFLALCSRRLSPFRQPHLLLIRKRKLCKVFTELKWKKNNNILHISLRLISISIFNALIFCSFFYFLFSYLISLVRPLYCALVRLQFIFLRFFFGCFNLNWNGSTWTLGMICERVYVCFVRMWLYEMPFVESKCILMILTHSPKPVFERRLCTRCWLCNALCVRELCCVLLCVSVSLFFSHSFAIFRPCNVLYVQCAVQNDSLQAWFAYCVCDWSPIVCDYFWYSLSISPPLSHSFANTQFWLVWEVRSLAWFIVYALWRFIHILCECKYTRMKQ